jgi:ABC-2 type transport system ATP-binding protein
MTSIVLRNTTVDIPIFDNTSRSLKKAALGYSIGGVLGGGENRAVVVRALSNISLELKSGDRLGLVGHNGAGKSTLLRVMAGIYEPTAGTVKITGNVAAMFDMGLGMNPDATGFDNIRMGGLYLGMSLKEIDAKLPDIAAFSELYDFLNLPVRTYSLGMRTRLTFSLVTSVDPEILVIDEGISAGDAEFVQKASERLLALVERSKILVLASHQLSLITELCSHCAILSHGQIARFGLAKDVVQEYGDPPPDINAAIERPEYVS